MEMKVSWYHLQPGIVIWSLFGLIFALLVLLNAWRILRLSTLQLTP